GMTLRCWKNLPVSFCGASATSQTIPFAPCSGDNDAFEPPMSVRTQPGQTEFTANFGSAAASCTVTPFNAVFEMQYAGAQPSAPSCSCPPLLETLTIRGADDFASIG